MTVAADQLTSTLTLIGYGLMVVTLVIGVAISIPVRAKAKQVARDMHCILRDNGIKCPLDANKKHGSLYAHKQFPSQGGHRGQGIHRQS